MTLSEISKQINALNRKKKFTEADYRRLSDLIAERAKELSRLTGMAIHSISHDEFKAMREAIHKK